MNYRIEIANLIRHGRAIGTEYVVTKNGCIIARFTNREDAEQWIVR